MNKNSNKINVCFVTDNGYALPTYIAISSLLKSKENSSKYRVYVLCNAVDADNKRQFCELATDGFEILCIDLDSIKNIADFTIEGIPATATSIYKFYIPEILKNENRVIFLDGDVIVRKDLSKLFSIDLGDKLAGAVKDLSGLTRFDRINPDFCYFNSGVLLLDLKKMRAKNISEKLMSYRKNGYNTLMDQDAFNVVFRGKVMLLPFEYNTQISALMSNVCREKSCKMDRMRKFWALDDSIKTAEDLIGQATVVHYTSMKPWKYYDSIGTDLWLKTYYESIYGDKQLNLQSKYIERIVNEKVFKVSSLVLRTVVLPKRLIMKLFRTRRQRFLAKFVRNED